ncbi:hypothetical protein [Nocardia alni]|uniref:hypothetical protein n=1 Tax=Nocardia alni TaxID=2815723 RepID=UPI0027DF121B|nr:hypothetical protein [Nocardia alni]
MQQTLVPTRRADGVRADLMCAAGAAVLVAAAFSVPFIMGRAWSEHLIAAAAPIFGIWEPHIGWGTGPAIVIAVLVVLTGPELARRLPWRPMLLSAWAASVAWTFSLAMIDGWQEGFAGRRLARHEEYLWEAGRVTDIGGMLHGFSGRILDFQPDSWATHVSGHPAGALLTFVALDRIGLGGGAWAAWVVVLAGCSSAVAVPIALNALGSPERARKAVPFLILAPAAVWIGVSADALFAGVTVWAVALASGLLFGYGLYLNYGLTLMVIPAGAVLLVRGLRGVVPAVAALIGVALVVAAFTASGFWWLDGYHLVVQRYYQGIASERPYSYWVWGNLAATVCAVGLACAAALHRVVRGVVAPVLGASNPRCSDDSDSRHPGRADLRRSDGADTRQVGEVGGSRHSGGAGSRNSGMLLAGIYNERAGFGGSRPHARRDDGVDTRDDGMGARDDVGGSREFGIDARGGAVSWSLWLDRWRSGVDPAALLAAAGLIAILAADLSGLSKAETERIWLPFDMWLLAGAALLPTRNVRVWLAVQALAALSINHLLKTNW